MNRRFITSTALTCAFFTAGASHAAIVELSATFDINQEVFITGANLFNIDPDTGETFHFEVTEYNRIINEELPFLYSNAVEDGEGGIFGTGQIHGKWRFDDSAIQGVDLGAIATNPEGVEVGGPTAVASEFQVIDGGMVIDSGSAPTSRVLVGNSISGDEFGVAGDVDVLAILAEFDDSPNPNGDTSEAVLLMIGNDNWFDNNTDFDLATALQSDDFESAGMTYFEETFSGPNPEDSLFAMSLSGIVSGNLNLRGLGNNTGEESDPLLPNAVTMSDEPGEGAEFTFDLASVEIDEGDLIFIDPDVAVGYIYEFIDGTISEIHAPSLADVPDGDGQYTVTINGTEYTLTPDAPLILPTPVSEFTLTGIDPALMLDPDNPLAFKLGVKFATTGNGLAATQTALVEFFDPNAAVVPLPAPALLLLAGLGGLGFVGRRKVKKA